MLNYVLKQEYLKTLEKKKKQFSRKHSPPKSGQVTKTCATVIMCCCISYYWNIVILYCVTVILFPYIVYVIAWDNYQLLISHYTFLFENFVATGCSMPLTEKLITLCLRVVVCFFSQKMMHYCTIAPWGKVWLGSTESFWISDFLSF